MSCEEMLPLLHGHLDGANSAAEEAQLQAHLHTCPACRSLLHQYEQMDAQVQQLEVEAPEQLAAGVMYKIGLEKRGKRKRFVFRS
ncbi:MAG: zf-HC2 domain-containing protein, partial [Clostridiales bacterium]|nr:zf-HC2 domain-containing protein [Clostridiales bacterium]